MSDILKRRLELESELRTLERRVVEVKYELYILHDKCEHNFIYPLEILKDCSSLLLCPECGRQSMQQAIV